MINTLKILRNENTFDQNETVKPGLKQNQSFQTDTNDLYIINKKINDLFFVETLNYDSSDDEIKPPKEYDQNKREILNNPIDKAKPLIPTKS